MKHCSSCEYCKMNYVMQYYMGIDAHECALDNHLIRSPYFEKCERYKKDSFSRGTLREWFADWLRNNK